MLKAVFSRCEDDAEYRSTRDNLECIKGGHYKGGGCAGGRSPKQALPSAEDLTTELPERRNSLCHRLD